MAAVQQLENICSEETENTSDRISTLEEETGTEIPSIIIEKEVEVCRFFLDGKCRFGNQCNYLHLGEPQPTPMMSCSPRNEKKEKKKKKPEEDIIVGKKPPLKTAGDVRHRILWDPAVPKEYFTLGYVDRFVGIVERPFRDFVWCDLRDAGPDDLAIPQHCMSYFKYKGTKVWDKATRLDHVFGSAGNNMKIEEKMKEIDEQLRKELEKRNSEDENSDDDEMNFDIILGKADGFDIGKEIRTKLEERLRATHFLCIKVNDSDVRQEIAKVQDSVCHKDPSLMSCAMPQELLHITFVMVKCNDQAAIEKIALLLKQLRTKLSGVVHSVKDEDKNSSQNTIAVKGLSTFGARVLYTKLQVPNSFYKTVDILHEEIRSMKDAEITNNFEFVPHMTLLKVNRPTQMARRSKYMSSSLYDSYLDHTFGDVKFDNIHFCSIEQRRGADGFYETVASVQF